MGAGDRVHLVTMGDAHLEATYQWLSRSETLRAQLDTLTAPTRDGNTAYWHAKWRDPTREDFAIVDGATGEHVGNCGLSNVDPARGKCELWIYLGDRRGGGRGSEAVRCLLRRAFNGLGLNRVYLRVVADNLRAIAFYEAIGFQQEGRFRQDTTRDGRFVDSIWLAMLASEYRGDQP